MKCFLARRNACLLIATVATLVLSIVFDITALASTLFPALWISTLRPTRRAC